MISIRCFFCNINNFGDQLNLELFRHFGFSPELVSPEEADVCAIGSILSQLPATYAGIVLGAGLHDPAHPPSPLLESTIPLVRGPLSASFLTAHAKMHFGDPGLLISEMFPCDPCKRESVIGLVPHICDLNRPDLAEFLKRNRSDVVLITPQGAPKAVAEAIAGCEAVIASSLHGMITAHSYGIPCVWLRHSERQRGKGFKFVNYLASIGISGQEPVDIEARTSLNSLMSGAIPPNQLVQERVDDVRRHFETLESTLSRHRKLMQGRVRKETTILNRRVRRMFRTLTRRPLGLIPE